MAYQVLNWYDEDVKDDSGKWAYRIYMFALNQQSETCCVHFKFSPYFYVDLKTTVSDVATARHNQLVFQLDRYMTSKRLPLAKDRCQLVFKKPFHEYTTQLTGFTCLRFDTICSFRMAKKFMDEGFDDISTGYRYEPMQHDVYEYNIPPMLRVMHATNVTPTGWFELDPGVKMFGDTVVSSCDHEFELVDFASQLKPADVSGMAPFVTATFDIEVYSSKSVKENPVFPVAENRDDSIVQIVTMFHRLGEETPYSVHAVVLNPKGAEVPKDRIESWVRDRGISETVELEVVTNECTLINRWAKVIDRERAMVFAHFNGLGFDEEYIYKRGLRLGCLDLMGMGFLPKRDKKMTLTESKMESAAYGFNRFASMDVPGIFHLDAMVCIKKDYKLDAYNLNACGEHFLNEKKTDLPPQTQFDMFREGTSDGLCSILEYCIQDVWLTHRLVNQLSLLTSTMEMAGQSWVPISYIVTRGQQIKAMSCIVRKTSRDVYLLRTVPRDEVANADGYQGATVLEPERGVYYSVIACLDFASLYPSIMRAYNLSHETMVTDENLMGAMPTHTVRLSDGVCAHFVVRETQQGILPQILEEWAMDRKTNKKEMLRYERMAHEETDIQLKKRYKFLEGLYDARQKANKVSMNSLYGFTGVSKGGMQACPTIAACITAIGREMILTTKTHCERMVPGSKIIYGKPVLFLLIYITHFQNHFPKSMTFYSSRQSNGCIRSDSFEPLFSSTAMYTNDNILLICPCTH